MTNAVIRAKPMITPSSALTSMGFATSAVSW
jgi:hypothetical protein